jgi:hypothetical protein
MDVLGLQPQSMLSLATAYRKYDFNYSDIDLRKAYSVTQSLTVSYAPAKWVDIRLNLPLVWMKNRYDITEENSIATEKHFGLGDLQLFGNFKAWSKPGLGNKKAGQQLNLGFGMELPTGGKQASQNELLQNFNFGSQSVDFLFSGIYSLSIRKWGITQAGWIKINTYNKERVKFGNMYSYQLMGNYSAGLKHSMLIPTVGIKTEIASHNLNKNIIQSLSGYWIVSLSYGLSWMKKNWKIGAMVQHPLAQWTSNGEINQKTDFSINFTYQFIKKSKQN